MNGSALFFVFLGIGAASANLMKLIEWLDTPRDPRRPCGEDARPDGARQNKRPRGAVPRRAA